MLPLANCYSTTMLTLTLLTNKVASNYVPTYHIGRTPLHFAAFNGSLACGALLLEKGAYINAPDSEGRTPLHWAVYNGYHLFVEILLDKNADTEVLDAGGRTPGKLWIIVPLIISYLCCLQRAERLFLAFVKKRSQYQYPR